ncbi:MAG: His/Gly/Thr/Pro-type tRNA ligase C-terminal domain-containing protein [Chitinophagaceae bacterium]
MGEEEQANKTATVKNLKTGEQKAVPFSALPTIISA